MFAEGGCMLCDGGRELSFFSFPSADSDGDGHRDRHLAGTARASYSTVLYSTINLIWTSVASPSRHLDGAFTVV